MEKLRTVMKVTENITIERLADVLGVDVSHVWDRIFDWANEFGFKIRGNEVIFTPGDVTSFINKMEREVIIKEIVKIKCPHCGYMVENTRSECPHCAGKM